MKKLSSKLLLINEFKTKRLDGHTVRTQYVMTAEGIILIERFMLKEKVEEGFIPIRKFKKFTYQKERMVFKLDSFLAIVEGISDVIPKLHKFKDQIIRANDILFTTDGELIGD